MFIANKLTNHFKKRETALKWLCLSGAYCLLFSIFEDPRVMTISLIGKKHLWLFMLFCAFCTVTFITNVLYMYDKFDLKIRFVKYLAIAINAVFPFTLTTLMPNISENMEITTFSTVVHWITGFGNIFINATLTLVLFLMLCKKNPKNKKAKVFFAAGTAICIIDVLVFLGMTIVLKDPQKSKNGLFEIIPFAVSFLVLYLINHTDLISDRKTRDESEKALMPSDTSGFSAVCFAFLVLSFATFTFYAFVRNPIHFTISMTGIDYPGGFALVCILLAVSFVLNFIKMFKAHGYKNYFTIALALVGSVAIIACVICPTTLGKEINPVHSIGALMFFYFLLAAYALFLIRLCKTNKKYRPMLIVMLLTLLGTILAVVIMFVVLDQNAGRTGLTEVIPLEVMFLFNFLENNTNVFSGDKEKILSEDKKAAMAE